MPHAMRIEGFNGSNKQQSWAVKSGKPEGRQCGDVVDLNSEECRIQCQERWGSIEFPTIEDYIADVILPLTDEHSFEGVDLWKQDLNGAHQLLFFAPEGHKASAHSTPGGTGGSHRLGDDLPCWDLRLVRKFLRVPSSF